MSLSIVDVLDEAIQATFCGLLMSYGTLYQMILTMCCLEVKFLLHASLNVKVLVRVIGTLENLLYVITCTPVPQSILTHVDFLLQGFKPILPSSLQVQGCILPYMSANVVSSNQQIE